MVIIFYLTAGGGIMYNNIISEDFITEVQSGKHVFGKPDAYISKKIIELDKEIAKAETIKAGEFAMQNKELRAELSAMKTKKQILEKSGDYFLGLLNKCLNEPWLNSILFCNVYFGNLNMPSDNMNTDIELNSDSGFISNSELSSLMGSSSKYNDEAVNDGEAQMFDFVFQTRFCTCFVNIRNVVTSPELPLFIMDGTCKNPKAELFELTEEPNFLGKSIVYDIIYNKNGALILKNNLWKSASSRVLHVKDFKSDFESLTSDFGQMNSMDRYKQLDYLYKHFVQEEKSEFYKDVKSKI